MEGIQTFKGSWPWPWPWIRPYGIPSCITHRPLPVYQISFKSKKLFVDGRTDGRTFFPPLILLGRLLEVDLKSHTKSYISPLCPEIPRESIFTKFGTYVPLVDVINPDKFCVNLFKGFDFTGVQSFHFSHRKWRRRYNSAALPRSLWNIIGYFGQQLLFLVKKRRNFQVQNVQGTNVPRPIRPWERMFRGTFFPGN